MSEIAPVSREHEDQVNALADKIFAKSGAEREKLLSDMLKNKEAKTVLPPYGQGWKSKFPVYLRSTPGGQDINGIAKDATLTIIDAKAEITDSGTHIWYKVRVDDKSQLYTKEYGNENIGWVSSEFIDVDIGVPPPAVKEEDKVDKDNKLTPAVAEPAKGTESEKLPPAVRETSTGTGGGTLTPAVPETNKGIGGAKLTPAVKEEDKGDTDKKLTPAVPEKGGDAKGATLTPAVGDGSKGKDGTIDKKPDAPKTPTEKGSIRKAFDSAWNWGAGVLNSINTKEGESTVSPVTTTETPAEKAINDKKRQENAIKITEKLFAEGSKMDPGNWPDSNEIGVGTEGLTNLEYAYRYGNKEFIVKKIKEMITGFSNDYKDHFQSEWNGSTTFNEVTLKQFVDYDWDDGNLGSTDAASKILPFVKMYISLNERDGVGNKKFQEFVTNTVPTTPGSNPASTPTPSANPTPQSSPVSTQETSKTKTAPSDTFFSTVDTTPASTEKSPESKNISPLSGEYYVGFEKVFTALKLDPTTMNTIRKMVHAHDNNGTSRLHANVNGVDTTLDRVGFTGDKVNMPGFPKEKNTHITFDEINEEITIYVDTNGYTFKK